MNGEVLYYKMAVWQVVLYVVDAVVAAGIAVWGVLVFIRVRKRTVSGSIADNN